MIWLEESKKIIKHPVMWCLLAVFVVLNTFFLWKDLEGKQEELRDLHKDVVQNTMPSSLTETNRSKYDNLDMVQIQKIKQEMTGYHPRGSFKVFIDEQYVKMNERVKEIKESGEAEESFYPGAYYCLHTILFAKLLRCVFVEMIFLICLSTLFLMDYERVNKTEDVVYASRDGRTLPMKKLLLGNGIGIFFGILLLLITLGIYFSQVSYEGLWEVPISAALMAVPRGVLFYPLITFREMSFWQYLTATCLVGTGLVVIIGLLAGSLHLFLRNSYYTFVVVMMLLLGALSVAGVTTGTWWDLLLSINPSAMLWRTGGWFMENEIQLCFEGNEVLSLFMQSLVVMILLVTGRRRWMRGDV